MLCGLNFVQGFKHENVIDDMFNNILNSDEEHVKKRQPATDSLYQLLSWKQKPLRSLSTYLSYKH